MIDCSKLYDAISYTALQLARTSPSTHVHLVVVLGSDFYEPFRAYLLDTFGAPVQQLPGGWNVVPTDVGMALLALDPLDAQRGVMFGAASVQLSLAPFDFKLCKSL